MSHDPTTEGRAPLAPAKAPVGPAPVAVIGVVVAILVTTLGIIAIRDALVAAGAITGSPWLTAAAGALDGLTPAPWFVAVGVVLLLLGLWLVAKALRPRPRSGIALRAETGVFLRPQDVARLASGAAADVDGVLDSTASASTRKLVVRVTTTGDPSTEQQVREAVTERLSHLHRGPSVRVQARSEGQAAASAREVLSR